MFDNSINKKQLSGNLIAPTIRKIVFDVCNYKFISAMQLYEYNVLVLKNNV